MSNSASFVHRLFENFQKCGQQELAASVVPLRVYEICEQFAVTRLAGIFPEIFKRPICDASLRFVASHDQANFIQKVPMLLIQSCAVTFIENTGHGRISTNPQYRERGCARVTFQPACFAKQV
jgi:hypothetical protein